MSVHHRLIEVREYKHQPKREETQQTPGRDIRCQTLQCSSVKCLESNEEFFEEREGKEKMQRRDDSVEYVVMQGMDRQA